MNKTVRFALLALVTGVGVGIGMAISYFVTSDKTPQLPTPLAPQSSVAPNPAPAVPKASSEDLALAVTLDPLPTTEVDEDVSEIDTTEINSPALNADNMPRITSLLAKLQEEQTARQRLETKLKELETALAKMDQRLTTLARRSTDNDRNLPTGAAVEGGVDTTSLMAAGFSAPEAEMLAQRWGEQQMDLLYLRDQAIREGWIDTPRFREARRDLRDGTLSLQEELGEEGYDRFLYATGQPNRVEVMSVFESSPAQISGLQTGDVIVSYDGMPIRSGSDVRDATTSGVAGEPVTVQLLRDGQPMDITLPRGPIGIRMDAVSVEPN